MITEEIIVANIKCNGCSTTIHHELMKLNGVQSIDVFNNEDKIKISYDEPTKRDEIIQKLHSLGYPEATEKNGLLLQLKSYTSCMVGRINNMKNKEN